MTCDIKECRKQFKFDNLCKIHTSVFKKPTEFCSTEIWTKFLSVLFSPSRHSYIFYNNEYYIFSYIFSQALVHSSSELHTEVP